MKPLSSFFTWFFETREKSPHNLDDLAKNLASQASYVTQSSMYAYTRARLGLLMGKAFSEDIFAEALYKSASIARLYIITDIHLLLALHYASHFSHPLLPTSLPLLFLKTLALPSYNNVNNKKLSTPPPQNPEFKDLSFIIPISLEDAQKESENRFHLLLPTILDPHHSPLHAPDIASFSAKKLFSLVPLTSRVKHLDEAMVVNNTLLRMMRLYEDISRSPHQQQISHILSSPH